MAGGGREAAGAPGRARADRDRQDAADTAFLSSYGGGLRLDQMLVGAVVGGDLPRDDLAETVRLD